MAKCADDNCVGEVDHDNPLGLCKSCYYIPSIAKRHRENRKKASLGVVDVIEVNNRPPWGNINDLDFYNFTTDVCSDTNDDSAGVLKVVAAEYIVSM